MKGLEYLEAQIKVVVSDIRHYWWVGVWQYKRNRYLISGLIFVVSLIYFTVSLGWLVLGLADSLGVFLQLIGICGIALWLLVWSGKSIIRTIKGLG